MSLTPFYFYAIMFAVLLFHSEVINNLVFDFEVNYYFFGPMLFLQVNIIFSELTLMVIIFFISPFIF